MFESRGNLSQLICETVYVSPLSNYLSFLHAQRLMGHSLERPDLCM